MDSAGPSQWEYEAYIHELLVHFVAAAMEKFVLSVLVYVCKAPNEISLILYQQWTACRMESTSAYVIISSIQIICLKIWIQFPLFHCPLRPWQLYHRQRSFLTFFLAFWRRIFLHFPLRHLFVSQPSWRWAFSHCIYLRVLRYGHNREPDIFDKAYPNVSSKLIMDELQILLQVVRYVVRDHAIRRFWLHEVHTF